MGPDPERPSDAPDAAAEEDAPARTEAAIARGEGADDDARAALLEELHADLEADLEQDVDQNGASGR